MRHFLACCALLAAFVVARDAAAQKQVPVNGMQIQLLNADGRVVETTTTDADGEWSFTCEPGTYTINIPTRTIEVCAMAINEKGLPGEKKPKKKTSSHARTASSGGDLDGDGAPDIAFTLNFSKISWGYSSSSSSSSSTREAGSGMATGKRQHKPITFVKEWGASSPQFAIKEQGSKLSGNVTAGWDLAKGTK